MEVWKKIEGFENYEVSNYGNVKGLKIKTNFGSSFKIYPERIINPWKDKKGYLYIDISYFPNKKRFLLHRLVAIHFINNKENKPQINHKDGNKSNNCVENLEWCTAKENLKHAVDTGLNKKEGVDNYKSKFSKEDIINIRKIKGSQQSIANIFNVSQTCIGSIKRQITYKNIKNE